ncbi:ScbR family autoregulator-binding transcription factor [Streptomyces sp. NPDC058221]|uniref:ScbR family autoregulator-binding transcription factor n=1 Tax=Streptomyces sp. NPDC058221 TaxID=3346388 RepID=UPI0036F05594
MAQQARAIQTRQSILVAAADVFDQRGYSSATISEILARAGVTKGALYFHFASKEDLALGVMDIQLHSDPLPPQLTKLQELVDQGMLLAHRLRHEPLVRASVGLAMDQAVEGLDRGTPFRAWIDRLEQLLRAAKGQGELLPHVDPCETAELLAGSFSGIQVMSQVLSNREDLGRRISVMLHYLLPSISTPAVLATLDMAQDRGERLLRSLETVPSQVGTSN